MRIASRILLLFCILLAFKASAFQRQIFSFEVNSPLLGGSDSTKVGYYYHQDNLNLSSALSDSSKNPIKANIYYLFGRTQTAGSQASFQVSRRFSIYYSTMIT
jgi:hypothetical protein